MNVLFIVADDLNGWIGALGRNPDVKTPNIDALATRGTLFVNAYCPAPYCNASRMAMFTGRPPHVTGVYRNEPFWEGSGRRPTFIERLGEAGYYRHGAGKVFHEGMAIESANHRGAASFASIPKENRAFVWDRYHQNTTEPLPHERPFNSFGFDLRSNDTPAAYQSFDWGPLPADRESEMFDEKVAGRTVEFLRDAPHEPFLCAAGFFKPHLPWYVPLRFFDLYDPSRISLPLVRDDDLEDVPEGGRRFARRRDHDLVTEHDEWRPAVHAYLASISYVDYQIGRVIETLDAAGLADRTAIVLCGDNGFHLGEKLHWRKFALWEEATRVPLIVSLPGRDGQRVFDPVSLIDLFPTLLDLAALDYPELDWAESLLSLMRPGAQRETPVLSTWLRGNHSIRTGDWRLTRYADGGVELYDHRTDPYEWTNLADQTEHRPVVEALSGFLPAD